VPVNSWDSIVAKMTQRMAYDTHVVRAMMDVRDRYNGDVTIALPDVEGEPELPNAAPNIIAQAIDGTAMRASSVRPVIGVPATSLQQAPRDRADLRRKAFYATWYHSRLDEMLLPRAYRHWAGYGSSALVVLPDFKEHRAKIALRDPLTAYPDSRDPNDPSDPVDVGFIVGMTMRAIHHRYPKAREQIAKLNPKADRDWQQVFDVVEWIDEDSVVLGILGPRYRTYYRYQPQQGFSIELARWDNRAGRCTAVVPARPTLDRIAGQVANITGMVDMMQQMQALEMVAAQRAVFPDMVITGRDGRPPVLVKGVWKEGRSGEPNELIDADVQYLNSPINPLTQTMIDRTERTARIDSGANAMLGGETPSSIRTGRAAETLAGFAIDPRVQEAQKSMGRSLTTVNELAAHVEVGYFGARPLEVFSGWHSDGEVVRYRPRDIFRESKHNVVSYNLPGADINTATMMVGQLVGAGLMSRSSGRQLHPMIPDATVEDERTDFERMKDAVGVGFAQQAAAGEITLANAARVAKALQSGQGLLDAVIEADEAMREEAAQAQAEAQAAMAAEGGGGPMPAGSGGLQPASPAEIAGGMHTDAPQAASSVPRVPQGMERLRQLSNALNARPRA
jgi:hypothetical protein